jgi:hypothetical protein
MTAANDNTFSLSSWALVHSVLLMFLGCLALWIGLAFFAPDVVWLVVGMIAVSLVVFGIIMRLRRK